MPNGIFTNLYWPKGVIKVVRFCDFFASGICQNPLLESSLLIILAPDSWANVSSTLGGG